MIKDLERKECLEILRDNYLGHLGYIANGTPYVLPITYYYHHDNSIICYSGEGHKINSMRKNNTVSLGVDVCESINKWRSVLIHGLFEELHQIDAKYLLHKFTEGVKEIIAKKEDLHLNAIGEFSSKMHQEKIPIVYRIKIVEITGKARGY